MALLESFAQNGAGGSFLTMATTHHGELKTLKYRSFNNSVWSLLHLPFSLLLRCKTKSTTLLPLFLCSGFWDTVIQGLKMRLSNSMKKS
jgi:hypothetical protein